MIEKSVLILNKEDIRNAIATAYGVNENDVEIEAFESGDRQYGTRPDVRAEITNFKRKEGKENV